MAFSSDVLALERDSHVATLWLDRPEARNAMGSAFFADLPRAMAEVSGDDEVRAVVVAARGPHFSVGLDLKEMGGLLASPGSTGDSAGGSSPAARNTRTLASVRRLQQSISSVADCPKPVIAAVHGYVIGGAIDLITACDIRLAAADAKLSVRETKVAIVADLGTLQRLPRIVSPGHMAELVYTGKDIDAGRAREIGLVNDVHPDHEATVKAARELAGEIAANSPLVVQGVKEVLRAGADLTVAQGLEHVAVWNSAFLQSADLMEAMTAFLEKRDPRYQGE
jgi:enoyl-CoA hydratase